MRSSSRQREDESGCGRTLRTERCVWRLVIRDLESRQKIMKRSFLNFSKQPVRRENLKAPAWGLRWRKSLWKCTAARLGLKAKSEKEAGSFSRYRSIKKKAQISKSEIRNKIK